MNKIPVIAVVGPTASGKSELAVEICLKFGGEVVSADSMQIYKGMDIATAKPTQAEKKGVPHHLMDFLPDTESFSVAEYKRMASEAIADISSRDKLPVICGGTGLYIDTLLNNIQLTDESNDPAIRDMIKARAQEQGMEKMLSELYEIDPEYAEKLHPNNGKRILRALELWYSSGVTMTRQIEKSHAESPYEVCRIGLDASDRQFLYERINRRVDIMLANGLEAEAREYLSRENTATSSQAIGCKELKPYFDGKVSFDEAVESLKQSTRRYAKRQLTWFRRNECINWLFIDKYQEKEWLFNEAFELVNDFLKGEGK